MEGQEVFVADEQMIQRLMSSDDEENRLAALRLLCPSGAAADPRALFGALGDESWRIRKEATKLFLASQGAPELSGEIAGLLYSDDNAGLRNTAVEILIALGRRAVATLLKEVRSADRDVRKFACDILGEIGDPAATEALVEALGDADENVRAAAAENLGKIGSGDAIPHLLDALEGSELSFRFVVLDALGRMRTDVPVERLFPFAADRLLRKALFDCLGQLRADSAIPLLVDGLTDEIRNVRESAAVALEKIAHHHWQDLAKALSATAGGAVPESLSRLLESANPQVRTAAVTLLGICQDGRFASRLLPLALDPETRDLALEALVHLGRSTLCSLTDLWAEADSPTRACLAFVIGHSRCGDADGHLLKGLASEDASLRAASADALGKVGTASTIGALAQHLDDSSPEVRAAAQGSLSSLGARHPAKALDALSPYLQADAPEQRRLAVLALGGLDAPGVDQALALAMKDESPVVRQAAIRALGGRAERRHLPALVLALTDEQSDVRQEAVQLLGETAEPEALQALRSALHDEDIWVRAAAVRSLGRFGAQSAADAVASAVDDPVGLVTIAALEVLSQFGCSDVQRYFEKALGHDDEEVVKVALQLLVQSGRRDWIPGVCNDLIGHRHWDVRITFARALAELVGASSRSILEGRLHAEEDDLVRQHLRDLLDQLGTSGE